MVPSHLLALGSLLIFFSKFESASCLLVSVSRTTTAATRRHARTQTQLSAWSIPVPSAQRSFLPSDSSSYSWYEDCGKAAVHRNVVYMDYEDDEQEDVIIWDNDGGAIDVGYGFARIEAYETYLAYADHATQSAPSQRRTSFLRRGLGKMWQRLRRRR